MNPETARALLDKYNAGQIQLDPDRVAFLESIASNPVNQGTGGTSATSAPSQGGTTNQAEPLGGGQLSPQSVDNTPTPVQAEQSDTIPKELSNDDKARQIYKDNISQTGDWLPGTPDSVKQEYLKLIKPEDKSITLPETQVEGKTKSSTPSQGTGFAATFTTPSQSERAWYDATYGTPAVEEVPETPNYSPAQKAQLSLLNNQLKGFDNTLNKINSSKDMNDDTKERLHFETIGRRQKVEELINNINEAATKNGITAGRPGKDATTGTVGKIEEGIRKEADTNTRFADSSSEELQRKDKLLSANEEETAALKNKESLAKAAFTDSLYKDAQALANYKEDPDRLMNSKNTAQRVGAAIAIILGGISQGLRRGGSNPGVDKLNAEIERDIQAQRATYDAKKSSFAAKNSLYGKMMEKYHDPVAAAEAAKFTLIDQSTRRIEQLAANTNSEKVKANGAAALLKMEQNRIDAAKAHADRMYALSVPAGGSAAPKLNDKQKETLALNNQFATVINGLSQYENTKDNPYQIENKGVLTRAAAGVKDWALGEGSAFSSLPEDQQDRALKFANAKNTLMAMASVMQGQGAVAEGEALRSATAKAKDERQLNVLARQYQGITQAKGIGQSGNVVPTTTAPPPPPAARVR